MAVSASLQIQDLSGKLEIAHQELTRIGLEKIELEKEINEIKEQNEELREEIKSFSESSEMDLQRISLLRAVSSNIDDIHSYNDNLNIKVSQHENLIKKLKSENIDLQKENEKYKIILEQLNEEKQQKDELQRNNTLDLENTIKELENECDRLREEINAFSIYCSNTIRISPDSVPRPLSPIHLKRRESNEDIFHVRSRSNTNTSMIFNEIPLFSELGNNSNSKYSTINELEATQAITSNSNYDNHFIMNDINIPSTTLGNVEHINCMDCKCEQYQIAIQAKMAEIDILKNINNNSKSIIKTLQKQMRMLRRKNEALRSGKKKNENENKRNIFNLSGCFS